MTLDQIIAAIRASGVDRIRPGDVAIAWTVEQILTIAQDVACAGTVAEEHTILRVLRAIATGLNITLTMPPDPGRKPR